MVECLKSVLLFVGILAVLLKCSSSQGSDCPFGCTCTVNESNDGTDVVCSGHLDSHLSFHLLHKVQSIRIMDYDVLHFLDLRDQNILDLSEVYVDDGPIEQLELSFNLITSVTLSHFNHLSNLRNINLSQNNIVRIDTSNVRASNTLQEINLEGNNLTDVFLDTAVFTRKNFPDLTIILYDNPLQCSCPTEDNALAIFAADGTPCITLEGHRNSTLDERCHINTGVNIDIEESSTSMGSSSSSGNPLDDFTTPALPGQNTSKSSSSRPSRILPLPPTHIPTTSTIKVVPQPTSTKRQNSQQSAEHATLIIGSSVAAVIAILTIILFILVSAVCKLKRRFIPLETDEGSMPVGYLSPIKSQDSVRGQHYISESTMRLSQLVQPDPYYEEIDHATNGLGLAPPPAPAPLPPPPAPVNITERVVIPYHVSDVQISSEVQLTNQSTNTVEDDVSPPVANQYLDIHP